MSKVQMMKGSDGGFDYIVVAEVDCLKIGIRPIVTVVGSKKDEDTGVTTLKLAGAIRVRAVAKDESTIVNVGKVVEGLVPHLEWSKHSAERSSAVLVSEGFKTTGWATPEAFIAGISGHDEVLPTWASLVDQLREEYQPVNREHEFDTFFRAHIDTWVNDLFKVAHKAGAIFATKPNENNVVELLH